MPSSPAASPEEIAALLAAGQAAAHAGKPEQAAAQYRAILARVPQHAESLHRLGVLALRRGDPQEACTLLQAALSSDPQRAASHYQLGNARHAAGQPAAARECFERAIALQPAHALAYNNLGLCHMAEQDFAQALACYAKAIELAPERADAWCNRGNTLLAQGDIDGALASFDAALARQPTLAAAHFNRAKALAARHEHSAALAACEQALALAPQHAEAWNNRGTTLLELGRQDEALASFERALHLAPDYAGAQWNKALLLLRRGELAGGWPLFEARRRLPDARPLTQAGEARRWLGDAPLAGKSILLQAEQGLGDTLQFCRYAPLLAAQGAVVVLAAQRPLLPLLNKLAGVRQLLARDETPPPCDYFSPLMSLPLACATTLDNIPAEVPYLAADAEKIGAWRERLGPARRPRVGLVWRGNPGHQRDAQRSLALRQLLPWLPVHCEYHSLQQVYRDNDLAELKQAGFVVDHHAALADFADTAALCSLMDCIVSVDTSVAHLAGALGKPTLLLLPALADWRWLNAGETSPWYPSLRLCRQPVAGDWESALGRMQQALLAQLPARRDGLEALIAQAGAAFMQKNLAQAAELLAAALQRAPEQAALHANLALVQLQAGDAASAVASGERAVRLAPELTSAWQQLGKACLAQGEHVQAVTALERAIAQQPEAADSLLDRALALQALGRHDAALADLQAAQAHQPANPAISYALGNSLLARDRPAEAVEHFRRSIALRPDDASAHNNLGAALLDTGEFTAALAAYEQAVALQPAHVRAQFNRATLLLRLGRYADGWPLFEWRRQLPQHLATQARYRAPLWLGEEDLHGKSLLLHAEQGLGDTLQFCRYVPLLAERGARVLLEAPQPLHPLLAQLPGVAALLAPQDTLPAHDYRTPLLSLPLACRTTLDNLPANIPYLQVDADKRAHWQARLGARRQPRVGLVWRGNPEHRNDARRSLALSRLLPFLPAGCEYHSLQKEYRAADRQALADGSAIHDHSGELGDFADTAALVSLMDLVVSVDTSVAHLAGALGKPTLLLLPFVADWRWLTERSDSPWYPSFQLLRQDARDDWQAPLQKLRERLTDLGAAKPAENCPPAAVDRRNARAQALLQQGRQLLQENQHAAAITAFQQALALQPALAEACKLCSRAQRLLGDAAGALRSAEQAVELQPDDGDAWVYRGNALMVLRRFAEAIGCYERAMACRPATADDYYNLGTALVECRDFPRAIAAFDQAIALRPDYHTAHGNRGVALAASKRFAEALESYDRAIALAPTYIEAYGNRAAALSELGRLDEAIAAYDQAIALKPDFVEAYWNKGLALLLLGCFEAGWPLHEWRWRKADFPNARRPFSQPRWLGQEDIAGKRILLHAEQGFGDTLQFCRYAQLVAERGAQVILEAPASLLPLLRDLAGVHTLIAYGDELPPHDFQTPLLSLPLALGTRLDNIPASVPYLQPDPAKVAAWQKRLGARDKPRIGLVWRGNPRHKNDALRSLPLAELLPWLPALDEYHSLQKEYTADDLATLGEATQIADHSAELADFGDTAALCSLMDLVVSVDTSVAHLAGALGKRCLLLLPFIPDWRWLLERSDSPWYPTFQLLRQTQQGDWRAPLTQLQQLLVAMTQPAPDSKASVAAAFRLMSAGHLAEAEAICLQILAGEPANTQCLQLLSGMACQQGQPAKALTYLQQSLACQPDDASAHANLGLVYNMLGRPVEALPCFDRAIALQPELANAHYNRGNTLRELGEDAAALASFERAIALRPKDAAAWNNRGTMLRKIGQPDEALASFARALALKPDYAQAHYNQGSLLQACKRLPEAIAAYDRAIASDPNFAEAYSAKGLALLLAGDYAQGWPLHEWRWRSPAFPEKPRICREPLWLGETALAGKRILLHAEQGLGDTLQFCRYASLLAQQGAEVVLEVQPPLVSLLRRLAGVGQVLAQGEPAPPCDFHTPLLSLPLACKSTLATLPAATPYLSADPVRLEQWRQRLGPATQRRIGLAWRGNPQHARDRERSLPLDRLLPYLPPGNAYHSLQKDYSAEDLATLQATGASIHDHRAEIGDFEDTAALCQLMDLVVSVDTSIAHLAGALARPTLLLLPFVPDWRWLLARDDTPWYPGMTLLRQTSANDWQGVLTALQVQLQTPATAAFDAALQAHQAGRLAEAEVAYRAILACDPQHFDALQLLGTLCYQQGDSAAAVDYLQQAIAIAPQHGLTYANLGLAQHMLGQYAAALQSYDQAIARNPQAANNYANKALTLLIQGHFTEGWTLYEQRETAIPPATLPPGLAHYSPDLPPARTLLWGEQGIGDEIMFASLLAEFRPRCSQLGVRVDPRLLPLFERSLPEITFISNQVPLQPEDYDCQLPLGSLPHLLRPTAADFARQPRRYLQADGERSRQLRADLEKQSSKPLCGIAWHSRNRKSGGKRSLTLAELAAAVDAAGYTPVSLQYGDTAAEIAALRAAGGSAVLLHPQVDAWQDLDALAALIEACELVVCIDNSTAHLAGALGKRTLLLLPQAPDWRWLLERSDSPWYPSLELLRQARPDDWADVLARLPLKMPLPGKSTAELLNAALQCHQRGELAKACEAYCRILAQKPRHFDALQLLGVARYQQGQAAEAIGYLEQAIALQPDRPAPYSNLGLAQQMLGRHADAVASFERAIALAPDYAEAHFNRANALGELGRDAEALAGYGEALRCKPDYSEALVNQAKLLRNQKRLPEALASTDKARQLAPQSGEVHFQHANTLKTMARYAEAEASYRRTIELLPDYASALNNLGNTLQAMQRNEEAIAFYERAIAARQGYAEAWNNLGGARHNLGQYQAAIACYDEAIRFRPDYPEAWWNKSLSLLLFGRLSEAWPLHEWRHRTPQFPGSERHFAAPRWQGTEELRGKTILVHAEQGLGDTLQFCRYVPLVAARGARVIFEAPRALHRLFAGLAGVAQLIGKSDTPPAHDFQIPLLSLPLALGTTLDNIPADTPYLAAAPEKIAQWRQRLGEPERLRVGLAWSGNPQHKNDANRSLPLALLQTFLPAGCEYHSLQKEYRPADLACLASQGDIRDHSGELVDFTDTAALCSLMDIVVSVDTSVAHLAGALARPTLLLLPSVPDWRWLLERKDSPWYPAFRLLRQPAIGDWQTPLAHLQTTLQALAGPPSESTGQPTAPARTLALRAFQRHDLAAARECLAQAIAENPDDAVLHANQGLTLHMLGEHAAAITAFDRSLALKPQQAETWCHRGNSLLQLRQYADAASSFAEAIALQPAYPEALKQRSNALRQLGQASAALACAEQALALRPRDADTFLSRANARRDLRLFAESIADYDQAIAFGPPTASVWNNRGNSQMDLDQIDAALASYDTALRIDPQHAGAQLNKAIALLLCGDFAAGLPLYEARWRVIADTLGAQAVSAPLWLGEQEVAGKTLLLHAEQGYGDTLQFCRYVAAVAARGARVILSLPRPLLALLRSLPGPFALHALGEALPPHDYQCPLMSLPLAMRTTLANIPQQTPYLHAAAEQLAQWRQKLAPTQKLRIGLVWRGSASHGKDKARSLPLAQLLTCLPDKHEYHSLQKDYRADDLATLQASQRVEDHSRQLADFGDTAALCTLMDIVVSVDTSVAHLAGALGKDTRLLLPFAPDWRWLRERDDSPWYPSFTLYRQHALDDWQQALARLARDLAQCPTSQASTGHPISPKP